MFTQMSRHRQKRGYVLKARRERQVGTRQRIIDAVVALHEEVGPSRTSIKAIAERAGVQRLTVYRHFPDERALLAACSSCWVQHNPPPDPGAWAEVRDPRARTAAAFDALFAYFSRTRSMLSQVYRDATQLPALAEVTAPFLRYLEAVADDLLDCWSREHPGNSTAALKAVLRHSVSFETWQMLDHHGWSNAAKRDRLLVWVRAIAGGSAQGSAQ